MNPLWASAVLPIATAALLAYVGFIVSKRQVPPQDRPAMLGFGVWWFSAAAILFIVGIRIVFYILGVRESAAYMTMTSLIAVPLSVGLAGLVYYLVYIYSGSRQAVYPIVVFYLFFMLFVLYYFGLPGERTVHATHWSIQLEGGEPVPGWMGAVFGLLVAGPVLLAVLAYGSLFFVVKTPEQRFRVISIFSAFALWFTPLLLGFLLGFNGSSWFPLVYQLPGIPAAALIILGFKPPQALQKRWSQDRAAAHHERAGPDDHA